MEKESFNLTDHVIFWNGFFRYCGYIDVSENSGTPTSSILIRFSIINHPFWGTPVFGNTHIYIYTYIGKANMFVGKPQLTKKTRSCHNVVGGLSKDICRRRRWIFFVDKHLKVVRCPFWTPKNWNNSTEVLDARWAWGNYLWIMFLTFLITLFGSVWIFLYSLVSDSF